VGHLGVNYFQVCFKTLVDNFGLLRREGQEKRNFKSANKGLV
jgi:hypothetical protein